MRTRPGSRPGSRPAPHGRPPHAHAPSRYHSARGCTRFRSGVTSSVHLRVTVSPSLLNVTPNFSRNWTSKCVYGTTDDKGTAESKGHSHAAGEACERLFVKIKKRKVWPLGHNCFNYLPCPMCLSARKGKELSLRPMGSPTERSGSSSPRKPARRGAGSGRGGRGRGGVPPAPPLLPPSPPPPLPPRAHSRFTTTAALVDTWPCTLVATAE